MPNCPKCNKFFEKARSLPGHISNCGKQPNLEKLKKMWLSNSNSSEINKTKEYTCGNCAKTFIGKQSYAAHRSHCIGTNSSGWSDKARLLGQESHRINIKNGKVTIGKPHTEVSKEKIRQSRFNYLATRSGKTAWERKNEGKFSRIENWFYENILLQHNLSEKYDIITEYAEYPYFIDFAFVNIKLAVELDGKQHFTIDGRIQYDIKRDKILEEKGWKVYRISYLEINKEGKKVVEDFMSFLENFLINEKLYENKVLKYKEVRDLIKTPRVKEISEYNKNFLINLEKNKQEILNSNIDFSKLGWVGKISDIIQITPMKVKYWMMKNLPEIYNNAYKRKSPTK